MAETQTQIAMPAHGTFCWNELLTNDTDACKGFYSALFGWEYKESEAGGPDYTELHQAGSPNGFGGMMKMGPEFGGAPAHWMSYVAVDDVDAAAAQAQASGGAVFMPPTDILNVGRFAIIEDPSGAKLSIITLTPM